MIFVLLECDFLFNVLFLLLLQLVGVAFMLILIERFQKQTNQSLQQPDWLARSNQNAPFSIPLIKDKCESMHITHTHDKSIM